MHPEYFQVRTAAGLLHVFERHSIIRVEVEGWPGYLERVPIQNSSILDTSDMNPAGVRVVVAMFAAGFVELEGQAAVDFLRLFYRGTFVIRHEEQ
jgi:hypothetical protein